MCLFFLADGVADSEHGAAQADNADQTFYGQHLNTSSLVYFPYKIPPFVEVLGKPAKDKPPTVMVLPIIFYHISGFRTINLRFFSYEIK